MSTVFECMRGRRSKYASEPRYKCLQCGGKFQGRTALEDHKRDCMPVSVKALDPCKCFGETPGPCQQHEADAW